MKKKLLLLIPLLVFVVIAGFFVAQMLVGRPPSEIPSPLIGKPIPAFSLPTLKDESKIVTEKDFSGQVWLLNVWASWCVSCRAEHPVLVENAEKIGVPIIGLNYKEKGKADGIAWLERYGDPYPFSIVDADGRFGIDLGVYGVPETFLIDKKGIIQYKHTGPINEESLHSVIIPKIKELNAQ
jgi:periplasmic protein thiol:disulfide oxidoreductases, DsbE subfamily